MFANKFLVLQASFSHSSKQFFLLLITWQYKYFGKEGTEHKQWEKTRKNTADIISIFDWIHQQMD